MERAVQFSAITSWARLIWEALPSYGIDADAVFAEVGIDPSALEDPNGRYPVTSMVRLWRLAVARSGDPCFGLTAAAQWHPTTWHGLGFAWLASETLEDALGRLERYSAIFSTAADIRLEERPEDFRLTVGAHKGSQDEMMDVITDAFVSIVVHMCGAICGPDFRPLRVELVHEGSGCRQKRREVFGAPIQYGARENALYFAKAVARKPLASANAELAHANERVVADYLAEFEKAAIVWQVRTLLIKHMSSGEINMGRVAELLNLSRRTLQRRLEDEGTSFKTILDDTRRELAQRLIRDRAMTLGEISYLLGFSETSSFSRACRRWTGVSPSQLRGRATSGIDQEPC